MTDELNFFPADAADLLLPVNAREAMKFGFYNALRTLTAGLATNSLTAYEYKVFSQNGEDGVILELLRRIGTGHKYFVEFGASYGHECNTRFLSEILGWRGHLMERSAAAYAILERSLAGRRHAVTSQHVEVTPENVDDLLGAAGVPEDFDVLSIDCDGPDYYLWQAIRSFRPRLIVIEYNGTIGEDPLVQRPQDPGWMGTDFFGASLAALVQLGRRKEYSLVHTELCGVNAFFVRDDMVSLVGEVQVPRRLAGLNLRIGGGLRDASGRTYIAPPT